MWRFEEPAGAQSCLAAPAIAVSWNQPAAQSAQTAGKNVVCIQVLHVAVESFRLENACRFCAEMLALTRCMLSPS
jgi:hypothetical protein